MFMELSIRPATLAERLYAYKQNPQIAERCGNPGYLWGKLDNSGSIFINSWEDVVRSEKTPEFKAEFDTVLDMLRFDERYGHVLKNRTTMIGFCFDHPQGRLTDCHEYVFRADTQDYSYLIRCAPNGEDNHAYIYPYRRELLDRHMKQAEKGIRFLMLDGREKFRIPDGESIQVTTSGAGTRSNTARYVDDSHFLIVTPYDSYFYHIQEFPKWLERHDGQVIPMRSTLPDKCYNVLSGSDEIIIIKKGESGYYRTDKYGHDRAEALAIVDECNEIGGVSKAQAAAMLAGSMFGWDIPAADPKNYDEQGKPIKPRHHDRGDAR